MRKVISYILIGLTIVLASCSDSWLTENVSPQGSFLEENYFQNDEQTENVLNAAYMYRRQVWFNNDLYFTFEYAGWGIMSNFPSDDMNGGGFGLTDLPTLQDLSELDWGTDNTAVFAFWKKSYYGINRCNLVLNNPEYESEYLPYLQAQASYLRAWNYAHLVMLYGEVPLIDHSLDFTEYNQDKSSYDELFNFIIADLKDAIAMLKSKNELAPEERHIPTAAAAKGLLGKVYLYMASPYYGYESSYYDSAAYIFDDIIQSGDYALEPVYDDIWKQHAEHGIESIHELEYSGESTYGNWTDGLWSSGNIEVQLFGARMQPDNDTIAAGWGFGIPSQNLMDAYDNAGDAVRKAGTIIYEDEIFAHGGNIVERHPAHANGYSKKRLAWKSETTPSGNSVFGWPTNERLMRYADILLMAAEALNRKSSPDDGLALNYVNQVRERANLTPISASGDALFEAIQLERRLELAHEGSRWQDLVRWGIAAEVLNQYTTDEGLQDINVSFIEGRQEKYPIPAFDIQSSGGMLQQNPAYE